MRTGREDAWVSQVANDEQHHAASDGDDTPPPPLPPRPTPGPQPSHDAHLAAAADRPPLQSKPTTAVSSMSIQTVSFPDGSRGTFTSGGDDPSTKGSENVVIPGDLASTRADLDDNMSVATFAPTLRAPGDLASLLGGSASKRSPAWKLLRSQSATVQPFETIPLEDDATLTEFPNEFDGIPDESEQDWSDWDRLGMWKSKLKHYMILSSAGKPIYSRHGDLALINSSMGVVQTIISFYEGAKNPLLGFTAGSTRFVVATRGPLYFVAISKLGESDTQLRAQLDALYMQILSTLTLPTLTHIFANRPSTDLRKPLEGTESLLSSLADSFTKGSPSALLGALECLKIRKSHRHAINNAFLKSRADNLLYGLIVAGGKLVSVIRPRKHSLHPSDLQLIFNMLFESGGVKAGGGDNWIPLCLPAFNNRGYLYMYVNYLDGPAASPTTPVGPHSIHEETAIIMISPDKESFFAMQQMKNDVVAELEKRGSLDIIRAAARQGRPRVAEVAPGSQISHFLFKSKANVQFCMSALDPVFSDAVAHRRLMSLYHNVHATVHAKHAHLKVIHCVGADATSLAWVTPVFEFYCVAGPNASRHVITQGANRVIQWAKREEERLFIIGGGVF
ncbi:Vacuolar fusion protein MON1 [Apiospora kogelbergensis]|uniref:Vacuolar fusion protein MON1 n=1 Tax=Apiospora kogelbergensis TaxID=1337665 RepID=A0AAW0QX37_9PEZI